MPFKKRTKPLSFKKYKKTDKLIDRFFQFGNRSGGSFSSKSIHSYTIAYDQFFKVVKKEFDKVKREDCEDFYAHLKKKELSKTSISQKVAAVKALFRYAIECQKIKFNPMTIRVSSRSSKNAFLKQYVPSREDIRKIFSVALNPKHDAIIHLLYYHGLRAGEICALKIKDVDFHNRTITIRGKGDKIRKNTLNPKVITPLNNWLRLRPNTDLEEVFVSPSSNKGGKQIPMRVAYVESVISNLVERTDIGQNITPHSFRRAFITHAIEEGIKLPVISRMVGHTDINTTMRYVSLASIDDSTVAENFKGV